jgi:hypothetical protein
VLDGSWLNVVKARSCDGGKGKRGEEKGVSMTVMERGCEIWRNNFRNPEGETNGTCMGKFW